MHSVSQNVINLRVKHSLLISFKNMIDSSMFETKEDKGDKRRAKNDQNILIWNYPQNIKRRFVGIDPSKHQKLCIWCHAI